MDKESIIDSGISFSILNFERFSTKNMPDNEIYAAVRDAIFSTQNRTLRDGIRT